MGLTHMRSSTYLFNTRLPFHCPHLLHAVPPHMPEEQHGLRAVDTWSFDSEGEVVGSRTVGVYAVLAAVVCDTPMRCKVCRNPYWMGLRCCDNCTLLGVKALEVGGAHALDDEQCSEDLEAQAAADLGADAVHQEQEENDGPNNRVQLKAVKFFG
jgi:hypothetical protein